MVERVQEVYFGSWESYYASQTTRLRDCECCRPIFCVAERVFTFFAIYELFSRYNELWLRLCFAVERQRTKGNELRTGKAPVIPLIRSSVIPNFLDVILKFLDVIFIKTGGEVQKHRIFYPKRSDLFVQNIRSFYAKGKGK